MKKVQEFTVLLSYPDWLGCDQGQESYLAHVAAPSAKTAIRFAQREAIQANELSKDTDLNDFYPLAVFKGWQEDIRP